MGKLRCRMRRKRKDRIDRLYDSFAVRDLTREEFRKEYLRLMNPSGLNRDLRRMVMDRQTKRTLDFVAKERKKKIDEMVKNAE